MLFTFSQAEDMSFNQSQYYKIVAGLRAAFSKYPSLFYYNSIRIIHVVNTIANNKPIATGIDGTAIAVAGVYLDSVGSADGPSFINGLGNRVTWTVERLFVHEMRHVKTGLNDISNDEYSSILSGGGPNPPNSVGPIVSYENGIYTGTANQHLDYFNSFSGSQWETNFDDLPENVVAFRSRTSFTSGASVDLVLHDRVSQDGIGASPSGIDTRSYTAKPNDLIFGYQGDDVILSGGGTDFVYGNDGSDTLVGGTGSDKLYGDNGDGPGTATGNDFLFSADWSGNPGVINPETSSGYTATLADGAKWIDYVADYMYGGAGHDKYFTGMGPDYFTLGIEIGRSFYDPNNIDQNIYKYIDVVSDEGGSGEILVSNIDEATDPYKNIGADIDKD